MIHESPIVERHGKFHVVRDDMIPGGTKQIPLRHWLPELDAAHFVYAASIFGKGGAALAYACAELGFKATLFIARTDKNVPWVTEVQKIGATIIWTDFMTVDRIEELAWDHAMETGATYLPLGFATAAFAQHLGNYARKLPFEPAEIWCPVVSGTMAGALEEAFPNAAIKGVAVVKHHNYQGKGQVYNALEKFVRGAAIPPPFPSWTYSDAKIWRFAQKFGAEDAVIWNSNA
ncbi:MAG: hypothetical protein JWM96_183 [Alphaproteobacteria bacterium]|nr:hypothetical protein [Alphaproteobacteria bacterium]